MEYVFRLDLLAVLYWIITALWVGEFWVFPSRPGGTRRDVYWMVMAILLSLGLTGLLHTLQWGTVEDSMRVTWRWLGTLLCGAGVGLRYWAAQALGEWFSRDVQATAQQPLVAHGPYRRWRHPLYLGLWLIVVGMNVLMGNIPGALLAVLLTSWIVVRRARQEERDLEAILGERYRVWKAARFWL